MSASSGTFVKRQGLRVRSDANSSGSAEFFEPLTSTSPASARPPRTRILSTPHPHHAIDAGEVTAQLALPEPRVCEDRDNRASLVVADLDQNLSVRVEDLAGYRRKAPV